MVVLGDQALAGGQEASHGCTHRDTDGFQVGSVCPYHKRRIAYREVGAECVRGLVVKAPPCDGGNTGSTPVAHLKFLIDNTLRKGYICTMIFKMQQQMQIQVFPVGPPCDCVGC